MKKGLKLVCLMLLAASMLFTGCEKKPTRTQVRWFVGLGAGSDEPTFAPQKAVQIKVFNKPCVSIAMSNF